MFLTQSTKTMTPKEKAEELFKKMYQVRSVAGSDITRYFAKQCSLIAVDEILNHHSQEQGLYRIDTYYWQQVKSELQSL
jgi:hypothetical protein